MRTTQIAFHKRRILRVLDTVAVRVILRAGEARVATVREIVGEISPVEIDQLIRSAHAIAAAEEKRT